MSRLGEEVQEVVDRYDFVNTHMDFLKVYYCEEYGEEYGMKKLDEYVETVKQNYEELAQMFWFMFQKEGRI